ncbi:MAG: hypothetical protein AB7G23_20885 [Vicinamibacterales bacterium]
MRPGSAGCRKSRRGRFGVDSELVARHRVTPRQATLRAPRVTGGHGTGPTRPHRSTTTNRRRIEREATPEHLQRRRPWSVAASRTVAHAATSIDPTM